MTYIDRSHSDAQEASPKKISGPTKTRRKAQAAEPSNVVTDLRSRDNWMKCFNAIAVHDRKIKKFAFALGNRLALYHNVTNRQCNPGIKELIKEFGRSKSTIDRGIDVLTSTGWITRKRGGRHDTADVLFHVPPQLAEQPSQHDQDADAICLTNVDTYEDVPDAVAANPYVSDLASIGVTQGEATYEQRNREERSAAASPSARAAGVESLYITTASEKAAAGDLSQSPAFEADIPETEREGIKTLRLCSGRVEEKDQGPTISAGSSCLSLYGCPPANDAALDHRIGHAACRPDTKPHHEVTKIMTDAIVGAEKHPRAGFQLRKLTPEESERLARRTEFFARVRQRYPNKPSADTGEVEVQFNRMLLDRHSFVPLAKTYNGLMDDLDEGRIEVENMPTLKTLLADNWQRVHGEKTRRAHQ